MIERVSLPGTPTANGDRTGSAELLDAQVYRLVHWRRAAREINYRRFFDVNDLVALHMEDPEVFAQTHALVLEWRRRGWVDGFRIDHPDGLLDPLGYFRPPRAKPPSTAGQRRRRSTSRRSSRHGERLRDEWPVAGTTGYDFLNEAEALFLGRPVRSDRAGVSPRHPPAARVRRRGAAGQAAGARDRALRRRAASGGAAAPAGGPGSAAARRAAAGCAGRIVETIAALPVYRTYVDERAPSPRARIAACSSGRSPSARARGRASAEALDLLAAALLAREADRCARRSSSGSGSASCSASSS